MKSKILDFLTIAIKGIVLLVLAIIALIVCTVLVTMVIAIIVWTMACIFELLPWILDLFPMPI